MIKLAPMLRNNVNLVEKHKFPTILIEIRQSVKTTHDRRDYDVSSKLFTLINTQLLTSYAHLFRFQIPHILKCHTHRLNPNKRLVGSYILRKVGGSGGRALFRAYRVVNSHTINRHYLRWIYTSEQAILLHVLPFLCWPSQKGYLFQERICSSRSKFFPGRVEPIRRAASSRKGNMNSCWSRL